MKKVLIIQFRPETEVADDEFAAFLKYGELSQSETERIRAEFGLPDIDLSKYSAVIMGGSPYCISDEQKTPEQVNMEQKAFNLLKEIIDTDFPFYGNCYGLGLIAQASAQCVSQENYAEDAGAVDIFLTPEGKKEKLLQGLPDTFKAFVGHKESCQITPPGAVLLASSKQCPVQLIRYKNNVYSSQFHAELDFEGLALRIDYYKNKGYFPPQDAEKLKSQNKNVKVYVPMEILKRFIKTYHKNQS